MNKRHVSTAAAVAVAVSIALGLVAHAQFPARLSDREFWTLLSDSSEPDGTFRSDNLVSNESYFQYVIPELEKRARPGGVYLGVGPEQNYSYIAAVRPSMAVIFDIRRGNLLLQLMYKSIFELAKDRADFVSILEVGAHAA